MVTNDLVSVKRWRTAAVSIFVIGMLAAVAVYVMASRGAADGASYRLVNGQSFAVQPQESQREMQELARLGGTASVMTFRFSRWFESLWRGQSLAYTLAVLATAVALACWYIAGLMAEDVGGSR